MGCGHALLDIYNHFPGCHVGWPEGVSPQCPKVRCWFPITGHLFSIAGGKPSHEYTKMIFLLMSIPESQIGWWNHPVNFREASNMHSCGRSISFNHHEFHDKNSAGDLLSNMRGFIRTSGSPITATSVQKWSELVGDSKLSPVWTPCNDRATSMVLPGLTLTQSYQLMVL